MSSMPVTQLLAHEAVLWAVATGPNESPQHARRQVVGALEHLEDHLQQDLAGQIVAGLGVEHLDGVAVAHQAGQVFEVGRTVEDQPPPDVAPGFTT